MEIFKIISLFACLLLITGIQRSASLSFGDGLRTAVLDIKQSANWKDGSINVPLEDDDDLSSDEDSTYLKEDKALIGVGNPATRTRPVFDLAQWAIGIGQSTVAGVDYGINGPRPPNGWGWGGGQGASGWGWPQGGSRPIVGATIVGGGVGGGWNVNCGGGSGGNRVATGFHEACPPGGGISGAGVTGWTPPYRPPQYNPTQNYRPWTGPPPQQATLGGYNPKTFCFYCLITKKKKRSIY